MCTSSDTVCFVGETLLTGLTAPRGLESLPDGRIVFIDGDATVRILGPEGSIDAYAPESHDASSSRIADLAVSPDFTETGHVYMAVTRIERDGTTAADIIRAREVAGGFGESATIVRGLATVAGADPILAVSADSTIYLALPANDDVVAPRGLHDGRVLAFTTEGRAAGRGVSPVVADGDPVPSGLTIVDGFLWLGTLRETAVPLARTILPVGGSSLGTAASHLSWLVSSHGPVLLPSLAVLELPDVTVTSVTANRAGDLYVAARRLGGEGVLLYLRRVESSKAAGNFSQ